MPTPALSEEFAGTDPARGRRDAALGALDRREATALERSREPVPTLRRDRYIRVPRRSDRYLYFELEHPARRHRPHHHDYDAPPRLYR